MEDDNRKNRMVLACALRGWKVTDLAAALGAKRSSLYTWADRGDPDVAGDSWHHRASRAKLAKAGKEPLTGARIAAVLGCPPEALEPGGPLPVWPIPRDPSQTAEGYLPHAVLGAIREALSMSADASIADVVAEVDRLAAADKAVDDMEAQLEQQGVAWSLVQPLVDAGRALAQAARRKRLGTVDEVEAMESAIREVE